MHTLIIPSVIQYRTNYSVGYLIGQYLYRWWHVINLYLFVETAEIFINSKIITLKVRFIAVFFIISVDRVHSVGHTEFYQGRFFYF